MKFGVIGAGNMIHSLLLKAKKQGDDSYHFYSPSGVSAKALAKEIGESHVLDLKELSDCDAIILAFKPGNLSDFCKKSSSLFKGKIIISILAGITIKKLKEEFESEQIIRIMPNLHSEYALGFNLFSYSLACSEALREKTRDIYQSAGYVYECKNEDELDSLTLFCASSPAFIYQFLGILQENIKEFAPDFDSSRELLIYLLEGSAQTLRRQSSELPALISKVASKGGVTQQALDYLNKEGLNSLYKKSFSHAQKRIDEFKNT